MQVSCTQCGAAVTVQGTDRLLVCPFCDTALVVDGSATLFQGVTAEEVGKPLTGSSDGHLTA